MVALERGILSDPFFVVMLRCVDAAVNGCLCELLCEIVSVGFGSGEVEGRLIR